MTNYRFPILLTIYLGILGFIPHHLSIGSISLSRQTLAVAQTPDADSNVAPQPSPPASANNYDSLMEAGYAAMKTKDFAGAAKLFEQALAGRPEDPIAQKALEDAQAQALGTTPDPESSSQNQSFPLLLVIGLPLLAIALLLAVGPLIAQRYAKGLKISKPARKIPKESQAGAQTPSAPSFDNLEDSSPHAPESNDWNPSLPVQSTTRLPNVDLILQLMDDLRDSQPRVRRRAIWRLAQISDSRSMQALVDTMIDTDSYERSLTLEALSQICIRTLRPMNQALAISLQDKNPQVRKNALRDLTRMYNVMSQITQLVIHATDDPDNEVQETAKWAIKQLNLPTPVRLDIPEVTDEEAVEPEVDSYAEPAELES